VREREKEKESVCVGGWVGGCVGVGGCACACMCVCERACVCVCVCGASGAITGGDVSRRERRVLQCVAVCCRVL